MVRAYGRACPGILGGMTDPRLLDGRRRAHAYLRHLEVGDAEGAAQLLAGLEDRTDLVFVGAELTALARRSGRTLSPSERASVGARQTRLQLLRDSGRGTAEGLRRWVGAAGEEALTVLGRSIPDPADRLAALEHGAAG